MRVNAAGGDAPATFSVVAWPSARSRGQSLAPTTPPIGHNPTSASRFERQLPATTILTYGLPSLGTGAMFGMLLLYFMKFSTDVLLIAPAAIGAILGVSRLWDAVSDPIAGYWSDRTRTRIGRRRPWILASAVPIGIAFMALWSPPQSLSNTMLVAWMAFFTFLFFSVYTAYAVPFRALGTELGAGYHDRTRVFASSAFLGYIGAFFAIGVIFGLERTDDPRALAKTMVGIAAAFTVATMVFTALRLREQPDRVDKGSSRGAGAFMDVVRNRYAWPLLGVHFLSDLGGASFASLLPYVSDYILDTPGYTAYYQLALLLGLTLGIPFWVPMSRRIGKRGAWLVATIIQVPLCVGYLFLEQGQAAFLVVGMFLIGFLNGAAGAVAQSMQSDVIDYDEYKTGERKEGVYFASWNFLQKTAFGINLAFIGFMLQWSGFTPNVEQSLVAQRAISFGFVGLPFLTMIAIVILLTRFRLDEKTHGEILLKLEERKRAAQRATT